MRHSDNWVEDKTWTVWFRYHSIRLEALPLTNSLHLVRTETQDNQYHNVYYTLSKKIPLKKITWYVKWIVSIKYIYIHTHAAYTSPYFPNEMMHLMHFIVDDMKSVELWHLMHSPSRSLSLSKSQFGQMFVFVCVRACVCLNNPSMHEGRMVFLPVYNYYEQTLSNPSCPLHFGRANKSENQNEQTFILMNFSMEIKLWVSSIILIDQ